MTSLRKGENTALRTAVVVAVVGRGKLAFYKNLDASASASFPNVAFYDASGNPGSVPDECFCGGLVGGFAAWLRLR